MTNKHQGVILDAIEALNLVRVLMRFHVKEGSCIDINDKIHSATDIYIDIQKSLKALQALVDDVPDWSKFDMDTDFVKSAEILHAATTKEK